LAKAESDILVFHHNLPAFRARRMNWLEHPVLRERQAMRPPALSPLPPLTRLELRSLQTTPFDAFVDPDERYTKN
jgi:hypothetical protein